MQRAPDAEAAPGMPVEPATRASPGRLGRTSICPSTLSAIAPCVTSLHRKGERHRRPLPAARRHLGDRRRAAPSRRRPTPPAAELRFSDLLGEHESGLLQLDRQLEATRRSLDGPAPSWLKPRATSSPRRSADVANSIKHAARRLEPIVRPEVAGERELRAVLEPARAREPAFELDATLEAGPGSGRGAQPPASRPGRSPSRQAADRPRPRLCSARHDRALQTRYNVAAEPAIDGEVAEHVCARARRRHRRRRVPPRTGRSGAATSGTLRRGVDA